MLQYYQCFCKIMYEYMSMIFYCCDKYVEILTILQLFYSSFLDFFLENYHTNKNDVFNMWERCIKLFEFFYCFKKFYQKQKYTLCCETNAPIHSAQNISFFRRYYIKLFVIKTCVTFINWWNTMVIKLNKPLCVLLLL